jgi:cytochrome c peroxidase
MRKAIAAVALAAAALVVALSRGDQPRPLERWTAAELMTLRSLSLASLGAPPPDPSNAFADDPRAAALGRRLFFDQRLSANGEFSCSSCHLPERGFQDGRPLGRALGTTARRTMTVVGAAYSPWLFWDGRKDSLWAQALGPIEHPDELGMGRREVARLVARAYRRPYEAIFGRLDPDDPTRVFVNVGKAIAAYERTLRPGSSRFDRYVEAAHARDGEAMRRWLDADEVAGLRLFVGRAGCLSCHNGPLLTNNDFHNTGAPAAAGLPRDEGRARGAPAVLRDEFNCRSRWSDAGEDDCGELRFLVATGARLRGAFRPPSLRNVAERAPYMHAGQLDDLAAVIEHYDRAPEADVGHSELHPLGLSERERRQLEAFLRALSALQ